MRVEKSWGHEELIFAGAYCMKLLVYERQIASSLHYHDHKHESFYVASGLFELDDGISDEPVVMSPGCRVVLPPGTRHRLRCIQPGVVVEASTADSPEDCVRLVPSES